MTAKPAASVQATGHEQNRHIRERLRQREAAGILIAAPRSGNRDCFLLDMAAMDPGRTLRAAAAAG